jgi:hypothetical protein
VKAAKGTLLVAVNAIWASSPYAVINLAVSRDLTAAEAAPTNTIKKF